MTNRPICKIENCTKLIRTKKWNMCQMHETRQRNHGDPNFKKEVTSTMQCKIENCVVVVYNKKNQLCMKHYQQLRLTGNFDKIEQKKPLIPLHIPNGEIIWNIQKAKKIVGISSTLETMVMCGYIDDGWSLQREIDKIIENGRYSKTWYYNEYIKPIIEKKLFYIDYLSYGEEISKLVDEIMDKGKTTIELSSYYWLNLEEFGIKTENNECSFIDTVEDLGKKVSKLGINLDIEEDYVICHKLKIHYRRYKKLMN